VRQLPRPDVLRNPAINIVQSRLEELIVFHHVTSFPLGDHILTAKNRRRFSCFAIIHGAGEKISWEYFF
jgi:hypothetical protein